MWAGFIFKLQVLNLVFCWKQTLCLLFLRIFSWTLRKPFHRRPPKTIFVAIFYDFLVELTILFFLSFSSSTKTCNCKSPNQLYTFHILNKRDISFFFFYVLDVVITELTKMTELEHRFFIMLYVFATLLAELLIYWLNFAQFLSFHHPKPLSSY